MKDAKFWIEHLGLSPHPEGGYFRETHRSRHTVARAALPDGFDGGRSLSTAIYFLLGPGQVSHWHRLKSDELWHFYWGGALALYLLGPGGAVHKKRLGSDPEKGHEFQTMVPAGTWFGAHPENDRDFSLVGCTVAPGFAFQDFELGKKAELLAAYPDHADLIRRLALK